MDAHNGALLETSIKGVEESFTNWGSSYQSSMVNDIKKWEFELTSEIEGFFGNLRTFIRRMYHHTTSEKLPEIVSEFCFRFSSPEMFNFCRFCSTEFRSVYRYKMFVIFH